MLIFADIIKNKKVPRYCVWKQDIVNEDAEFLDKSSAVDKNLIILRSSLIFLKQKYGLLYNFSSHPY